jgi:hypothetical protein
MIRFELKMAIFEFFFEIKLIYLFNWKLFLFLGSEYIRNFVNISKISIIIICKKKKIKCGNL